MAALFTAGSEPSGLLPEVAEFGSKHGLNQPAQKELQELMDAAIELQQKRVTVSVPATVAHLGPGLECIGMAVDIWDEFTLEYGEQLTLEVIGDPDKLVPRQHDQNLVIQGAASAFKAAGRPLPALHFRCHHHIPYNKGLGAAQASFVGGYLAASVLCSEELRVLQSSRPTELKRASSLANAVANLSAARAATAETGPPVPPEASAAQQDTIVDEMHGVDMMLQEAVSRGWNAANVAPAIYGALQIAVKTSSGMRSHRVPLPNGLICVIFVPDGLQSSKGLPSQPVDRKAAVPNVGRTALLVNCFCSNNFDMFQKVMESTLAHDKILEQSPLISPLIQAALEAGATGACPCGYGPSVMALITGRSGDVLAQSASNQLLQKVAKAMLSKAEEHGKTGEILIAKPADVGAHVVSQKSEFGASRGGGRIVYFQ